MECAHCLMCIRAMLLVSWLCACAGVTIQHYTFDSGRSCFGTPVREAHAGWRSCVPPLGVSACLGAPCRCAAQHRRESCAASQLLCAFPQSLSRPRLCGDGPR
jgi:hypothetical protein